MARVYKTKAQIRREQRNTEIVDLFCQKTGAIGPIIADIANEVGWSKWTVRAVLTKEKLIGFEK